MTAKPVGEHWYCLDLCFRFLASNLAQDDRPIRFVIFVFVVVLLVEIDLQNCYVLPTHSRSPIALEVRHGTCHHYMLYSMACVLEDLSAVIHSEDQRIFCRWSAPGRTMMIAPVVVAVLTVVHGFDTLSWTAR